VVASNLRSQFSTFCDARINQPRCRGFVQDMNIPNLKRQRFPSVVEDWLGKRLKNPDSNIGPDRSVFIAEFGLGFIWRFNDWHGGR